MSEEDAVAHEGEDPPVPDEEPAPRRYPSTVGGALYLAMLFVVLVGIVLVVVTSWRVGIRVIAEEIIHKTTRHAMTSYFTMVAVDDQGCPVKVPALQIETPNERRRYESAALRREFRREIERRNDEIRQVHKSRAGES